MEKIIIAIDGFSSCGKSTMAKKLAKDLKYIYIDTGAMYRAVTLFCIENGLFDTGKLDESRLENMLDDIAVSFSLNKSTGEPEVMLNGRCVERYIRGMEVSNKVSIVSAVPSVRRRMVALQREMGETKGIVMDGRDIGTTVFPNAELKVFVTADPKIRAERRVAELRSKGSDVSLEEVLRNVEERDLADRTRAVSPLCKADDAVVLDNTYMSISEQDLWLKEEVSKRTCHAN